MEKIWDGYISGELPIDIPLKEAYSQLYNIEEKWIKIKDVTLKEYMQQCTDELEYAGYDLDKTPLKYLKEEFLLCNVLIEAPPEYIQLSESLSELKKQVANCEKNNYPQEVIDKLVAIQTSIESKIKDIQ